MKSKVKSRVVWVVAATMALCVCYVLSRHDVLGQWHFMKQWPLSLFVFGLIIIAVTAFTFSKKVMICTPIGYIVGFVLAMMFNADGVDQGGGRTNNAWGIWIVSFVIILLIGIMWELVGRYLKRKKGTPHNET